MKPLAMTSEEFVASLYRACLGREPDEAGLADWVNRLQSTEDHTLVLKGILESAEYQARVRATRPPASSVVVADLLRDIARPLRIVDIGAQDLGRDHHAYAALLKMPVEIIGFDPLEERIKERAQSDSDVNIKLYPYAIGDGSTHTLHINNDDATSSLFPLNTAHNARFNHLHELHMVNTQEVATRRLDEVLPAGPIDFLKLDTQGSELMILEGAQQSLTTTAVVHCEVEFGPIYLDQPLFPSIYNFLVERGFEFIDVLTPGRYHPLTESGGESLDQLLWGDAVFFRVTSDKPTRLVQSLIAEVVYKKPTLAEYLEATARAT